MAKGIISVGWELLHGFEHAFDIDLSATKASSPAGLW